MNLNMLRGFKSETVDSQLVFRKLLSAMAHPGTIEQIDIDLICPGHLHNASGAILLSLLDYETPLWSDLENGSKEIQWLKFHTGAPFSHIKSNARFALATDYDHLDDPNLFHPGTLESPDHSATLLIQTRDLDNNGRIRLTGPGIKTDTFVKLAGIKEAFLNKRLKMNKMYPLGVDIIFICENRFLALPRTTVLEVY